MIKQVKSRQIHTHTYARDWPMNVSGAKEQVKRTKRTASRVKAPLRVSWGSTEYTVSMHTVSEKAGWWSLQAPKCMNELYYYQCGIKSNKIIELPEMIYYFSILKVYWHKKKSFFFILESKKKDHNLMSFFLALWTSFF